MNLYPILYSIRLSYSKDSATNQLKIMDEIEERDSRIPEKRRSHLKKNDEQNHYYPFGLKHEVYISGGKRDYRAIPDDNDPKLIGFTQTDYQYKYNGKELQDELGLGMYDYGWRNYDPAIGRFNKIDRFAEKYFDSNPYHYTKNNPIYFVDVMGDSLTFHTNNQPELLEKVKSTMNNGLGGDYVSIGKDGLVTINASEDAIANMTEEQKAFYDVISDAANLEKSNVNMTVVENSESVMVGNFDTREIDIGDINKFPNKGAATKFSKLGHEIKEQTDHQREGLDYDGFRGAHAQGSSAEAKIAGMGARLDIFGVDYSSSKNSTLTTRFRDKNGNIISVNVKWKNGNVVSVKQKK